MTGYLDIIVPRAITGAGVVTGLLFAFSNFAREARAPVVTRESSPLHGPLALLKETRTDPGGIRRTPLSRGLTQYPGR